MTQTEMIDREETEITRGPRADDEFRIVKEDAVALRRIMRKLPDAVILTRTEIELAELSVRQLVKGGVIRPLSVGCPEQAPAPVEEIVADVLRDLSGPIQKTRALLQLVQEPTSISPKANHNPANREQYARAALEALPMAGSAIPELVRAAEQTGGVGAFARKGLRKIASHCGPGSEPGIEQLMSWINKTTTSRDGRSEVQAYGLDLRQLACDLLINFANATGDREALKLLFRHSVNDPHVGIRDKCADFVFDAIAPAKPPKPAKKKAAA